MALITLDEAKNWLEISHPRQDDVITAMINQAESIFENSLAVKLTLETRIESTVPGGQVALWLPWHPVVNVRSITDENGDTQYTGSYILTPYGLRMDDETPWDGNEHPRWTVIYDAGWTDTTRPYQAKLEVLNMLARAYNNRTGISSASDVDSSLSYQDYFDSDFWKRAQTLNFNLPVA